jgi:hypothetical protein
VTREYHQDPAKSLLSQAPLEVQAKEDDEDQKEVQRLAVELIEKE